MEMEDKKRVPSCRRLSAHLPVPPISLSLSAAARSDLSRPTWVLAAQEDQSRLSASVCAHRLYLPPVCLTLLPRYKSQPLMHEAVRLGSGSLAGQVWTKCQQFPVRPHSAFAPRPGQRPKGRRLTTGRRGAIDRPIEPRTEASDPLAQVKTTLMSRTHTHSRWSASWVESGTFIFFSRFYMNVFQASLLILSHFRSFSTQRNTEKKAVSKCSNRKIFSIGYETPALIFSRPGWTLSWALWEFKASSHHLNKKKLFDCYHRLNPSTFLGGFFFLARPHSGSRKVEPQLSRGLKTLTSTYLLFCFVVEKHGLMNIQARN